MSDDLHRLRFELDITDIQAKFKTLERSAADISREVSQSLKLPANINNATGQQLGSAAARTQVETTKAIAQSRGIIDPTEIRKISEAVGLGLKKALDGVIRALDVAQQNQYTKTKSSGVEQGLRDFAPTVKQQERAAAAKPRTRQAEAAEERADTARLGAAKATEEKAKKDKADAEKPTPKATTKTTTAAEKKAATAAARTAVTDPNTPDPQTKEATAAQDRAHQRLTAINGYEEKLGRETTTWAKLTEESAQEQNKILRRLREESERHQKINELNATLGKNPVDDKEFATKSAAEQNNILKGLRAESKRLDDTRAIQSKLGLVPTTNEDFVKETTKVQKDNLASLRERQRVFDKETRTRQEAGDKIDAYPRVRDSSDRLLAVAGASEKGTKAVIGGQIADTIREDTAIPGLLNEIITGKKKMAELTDIEVRLLNEGRLLDEESIGLKAERVISDKKIADAVKAEAAFRATGTLAGPEYGPGRAELRPIEAEQRAAEAARRASLTPFDKANDRERADLQRRAATIISEQDGTNPSDEFRKLNGSSLESLRQYNVLLGRTNAEQAELIAQGAKQVEAKKKAAEIEAENLRKANITPFQKDNDRERANLQKRAATIISEQDGTDPSAEFRKLNGSSLESLRQYNALLGRTNAEQAELIAQGAKQVEAKRKAAEAEAEATRKANITPFNKADDKERLALQTRAATIISEQDGTDPAAEFRKLNGSSLESLRQYNALLGRTNAEQAELVEQGAKQVAAKKKAAETEAENIRKANLTPFDKENDRERATLQKRAATIISEQDGTDPATEFRKLNGSSLESLRQYNALLGRTNAEQEELVRQGAKQVEAKRLAALAEAEAARKALVTPFTKADEKEANDLRQKIATRLNQQFGLDPSEEFRKRANTPLQALRDEKLLVGPTAAEQAAQNAAAQKATDARRLAAQKADQAFLAAQNLDARRTERGVQLQENAQTTTADTEEEAKLVVSTARLARAREFAANALHLPTDTQEEAKLNVDNRANDVQRKLIENQLSSDPALVQEEAKLSVSTARLSRARETAANALRLPSDTQQEAKLNVDNRANDTQRKLIENQLSSDPALIQEEAQLAASTRVLATKRGLAAQAIVLDPANRGALNDEATQSLNAKRINTQRDLLAVGQVTDQDVKAEATLQVATRALAVKRDLAAQAIKLDPANSGLLDNEANSALNERRLASERALRVAQGANNPIDINREASVQVGNDRLASATRRRAEQLTTQADRDAAVADVVDAARRQTAAKLAETNLRLSSPGDIAEEAQLKVATSELAAKRTLATQAVILDPANRKNLENEADVSLGAERIAAQKSLIAAERRSATDINLQGEAAAARFSLENQLKASELRELRTNQEFLEARAQRIIEEKLYNQAQRKVTGELAREQGVGGSNPLSRLLGRFGGGGRGGGGGDGIDPGLGGFFGGGIASLAKFAIPSALAFGAFSGLKSSIQEAEGLEKAFAGIKDQFDSTLGAGSAPAFATFKKNILDISKATGVTATDLAAIGAQLQGAFGKDITLPDTKGVNKSGQALVADQIQAAAETEKVTGLSATEITNSLTAASITFGVGFRRIVDVALSLQNQTGVQAKEIIPLLADVAPAAKAAGFSLEEFATIAADVQQKSGQSGGAIAQAFVRVLPQITQQRAKILALAQTNPVSDDFIAKVSAGNVKEIIGAVAKDFNKLNQDSQDIVTTILGGKRDADAIIATFTDPKLADKVKTSSQAGDLLNERFKKITETLTEQLGKLKEKFRQLGVEIYESGLGDGLKLVVELLSALVSVLGGAFSVFGQFNGFLEGWPGKILLVAAAFKLLGGSIGGLGVNFGIGAALTGIKNVVTGTTTAATAAKTAEAAKAAQVGGGLAAAAPLEGAVVGAAATEGAAGGFGAAAAAAGPAIAAVVVALAAAKYVSYIRGVGKEIDASKKELATQTIEELKSQLAKDKDHFDSGGGFTGFRRDIVQQFKRGVTIISGGNPDDTDKRKLINDELNKKNFEATGAAPKPFDPRNKNDYGSAETLGTKLNPSLPAEAIRQALSDKAAIAEIQAKVVNNINQVKSQDEIKASLKDYNTRIEAARNALGVAQAKGPENYDEIVAAQANLDKLKAEFLGSGLQDNKALIKAAEKRVKDAEQSSQAYPGANKAELQAARKALDDLNAGLGSNPVDTFIAQNGDKDYRTKLIADLRSEDPNKSQAAIAEIINRAATTDNNGADFFNLLKILLAGDNTAVDAAIKKWKDGQEAAKVEVDSQAQNDASKKTIEEIKSLYDLGQATITQYIDGLAEQINFFNTQIAARRAAGLDTSAEELSKLKAEAELSSVRSSGAVKLSDLRGEINQIGKGKGDATDLEDINRLTEDIRSGKLNPADKLARARAIINLLQGLDKDTKIPDEARQAIAEAQFDPTTNEDWSAFLKVYIAAFGANSDAFVKDLLVNVALGKTTVEAAKAIIAAKIAALAAIPEDAFAATGAFSVTPGGSATIDPTAILASVTAVLDKTFKVPDIAKSSKSSSSADNLAERILQAKQDYYKALVENDPIKTAELAVQQAEEDYAKASGDDAEVERWKAMADKVRALRQLDAARNDILSAQADLSTALDQFRGDTLKVAQDGVDKAVAERDAVNKLFETGGGDAEKLKAEVGVVQAKASARDAQLASQKDDYQFLYDMGQITKQQFIEYLKTLKQIPDLTTAQLRDLDRQIKQLSGELNQDLQFNLPTKFKLPTVYEVRRIEQTGSSQTGYVDNRNVNITINVQDGSSQQQMLQVLTDVMGAPARISGSRKY